MDPTPRSGPVVLDREDHPAADPSQAELILDAPLQGAAMAQVMALGARQGSPLMKWFLSLILAFLSFVAGLAAWDYVTSLLARSPVLGTIATGLLGLALALLAVIVLREGLAIARLGKVDAIQRQAQEALIGGDLTCAQRVVDDLERLYAGRAEFTEARRRVRERKPEVFDVEGLLVLAESELLQALDAAANREVELAARRVATVTALVPVALADLFGAFAANLYMIRRIFEIYGGRAGAFGAWRLTKIVMAHLITTGALAAGDDMLGSLVGEGLFAKLSRRFGEGVVNGALTARVGVAAIEVCRPLPFLRQERPKVTSLMGRLVTGLFSKD